MGSRKNTGPLSGVHAERARERRLVAGVLASFAVVSAAVVVPLTVPNEGNPSAANDDSNPGATQPDTRSDLTRLVDDKLAGGAYRGATDQDCWAGTEFDPTRSRGIPATVTGSEERIVIDSESIGQPIVLRYVAASGLFAALDQHTEDALTDHDCPHIPFQESSVSPAAA